MKRRLILLCAAALAVVCGGVLSGAEALGVGGMAFVAFGVLVGTEGSYLTDVVHSEQTDLGSRSKVTVASGENIAIGTVLGKITRAMGDVTADAGNVGDGTLTGEALGARAMIGTYIVECITEAANGGTFKVVRPDGVSLDAIASVGVAFESADISFTLNDGATDFDIGDSFAVEVVEGSGKVGALDPTAVDGLHMAYGVIVEAVDASAADVESVAIDRLAEFKESGLAWPEGISDADKASAIAALRAAHMIIREVV